MRIAPENTPLPCPCCVKATSPHYVEAGFGFSVECPGCRMRGPSAVSTDMALKAWNRIPRLPAFSNEKPDSPGFYFMRDGEKLSVVRLHPGEPGEICPELLRVGPARSYDPSGMILQDVRTPCEWAGPLPLPCNGQTEVSNGK